MRNKKGFTLLELLTVIVIVGILLVIAVPTISRYIKKGKNSYYYSLENDVKVAGIDYMETYRTLLPRQIGHVTVVEIDELINNKYIDKVVDEKGNLCSGQVAVKKIKTDGYEYHSCIRCGEYYESGEECNYSELDNKYTDSGDYRIEVEQDRYEVDQTDEFVSPLGKVYYKNELIKSDLEGKPKKVDTKEIGEHEVVYYYHGAIKKIIVEVKDSHKPGETKVVLRYDDEDGKSYKGNWYSGNIYAEYKATDYTDKGIIGSGVSYYEVSSDGSTYTRVEGNKEIIKEEGNYLRYVRAIDKSGNIGEVKSYRIKIDKTKPTCSFSGESTEWLNGNRQITATCSDSVSSCTEKTQSKTWNETTTVKTKLLSYTIKDQAGNTATCNKEANIYIDKTKPVITAKLDPKTLNDEDYSFVENLNYNDSHSGINISTLSCSPSESLKSGTYDVVCTVTDNVGNTNTVKFEAKHSFEVEKIYAQNGICGSGCCLRSHTGSCCDGDCNCYTHEGGSSNCYGSCGSPDAGADCCGYCGGGRLYTCDICDEYGTCSCYFYSCPVGTHHADGSSVSKTDNICYY